MTRTLSEATILGSVAESTFGTAPTTLWRQHQPNTLDKFGGAFKKISRNPLGSGRQVFKGDIVDLEAPTEWTADLTKDLVDHFVEGLMMAKTKANGGTGTAFFRPTAAAATSFTVASGGTLQAGSLIYGRGFLQAANNGLRVVGAASGATSITISGGAVETVSGYLATVEVAGWRGTATDIGLDVNGNLTSTAADFTTMGLVAGQWIWVGGNTALGGANSFATLGYRGFAQIVTIAAHLLTLRRRSWTVGAADAGTGKTIDLYWGRWIRNVTSQNADYLETSYTFEVTYGSLSAGAAEFEYSQGNLLNSIAFDMPPSNKVTCALQFVGATTIDPSTTRLTGASSMDAPLAIALMNTSVDMARLRFSNTDETGLSTDVRSLKVTLTNTVSREVVLGYLGARFMNVGEFTAMIEGELLFTNESVVIAVRDNRTATFEVSLRNGDGGFLLDVPSATLDSTDRKFTANESVTITAKASGFSDPTYGYTAGLTIFPFLPAS